MALHALSLCSGIGGLDLALRSLGVVSVGYVERDAYAAAVLVERMADKALDPGPVWSDLATFDALPWRGVVDVLASGVPCQPFSCAGSKRGVEDERHLWPLVARLTRVIEPRLVVVENVAGLVRLGLRSVLEDLAGLGFDAEWGVLSAADVGAPHGRDRLFLVAWRGQEALEALAYPDGEGRGPERESSGRRGGEGSLRDQPDGRSQEDASLGPWPPASDDREGWAWVLAARPDLAPAQPVLRDVADGTPGEVDGDSWGDQLRCLGNAVVPVQAATAIRALARRGLA